MVGIYKITSPSGRIYIGQSHNIKNRWYDYKKSGAKGQTHLHNSFLKYGTENHKFEFIYELPLDIEQEILNNYEIFIWAQYKEAGFQMMNIRDPGSKGKLGEVTKEKIKEKRALQITTLETRILMGEARHEWAVKNPDKLIEIGKKISEARMGMIFTEEHLKNLTNANRKNAEKRKISIIQLTLEGKKISEFSSIKEASIQTGIHNSSISRCMNGKVKNAGNFKWMRNENS